MPARYAKACVYCEAAFTCGHKHQRYCGSRCNALAQRFSCEAVEKEVKALRRIAKRRIRRLPLVRRACLDCGRAVAYRPGDWRHCVCATCAAIREAKRAERLRADRRTYKAKRRARIRGAERESIDPIKVFARDGWRCRLCGKSTPQGKRGTHDPRAPELDHIIALADGGTHTWGNVQCACRACNQAKGDKSMGQLGLPIAA